ncbi:CopG family transcriptional regulator [bacterium]|nr:CopG family transcriptional regulator [bacterium]MDB4379560.1 CopG family transcriptional regulator [bacterium]
MRTTLQLDDDVLAAARVLARQRQSTIGDVMCDLTRQTLSKPAGKSSQTHQEQRSELPQLPVNASGCVVDLELVNQLRDEDA